MRDPGLEAESWLTKTTQNTTNHTQSAKNPTALTFTPDLDESPAYACLFCSRKKTTTATPKIGRRSASVTKPFGVDIPVIAWGKEISQNSSHKRKPNEAGTIRARTLIRRSEPDPLDNQMIPMT